MPTTTIAPPERATSSREATHEAVPAPAQPVPVDGEIHAFDRDRVLVLPGGLRVANNIAALLFFTLFVGLWLAFAALLIVNQNALDTIWQHIRDLPLAVEILVWVLFLPIVVGLWIWETDAALAIRIAAIAVVSIGWTAVMFPWPRQQRQIISNGSPGWHEVPPETTSHRTE